MYQYWSDSLGIYLYIDKLGDYLDIKQPFDGHSKIV